MYLTDLEPEDVFSGRVLRLAKQWTRPLAARYLESARQADRDTETRIEEMGHEMGLEVWKEGQRSGAGAPIVAKKFCRPTQNQLNVRNGVYDQSAKVLPRAIPKSWEKAAKDDEGDPDDLGSISS
jgi:hypothetical protein